MLWKSQRGFREADSAFESQEGIGLVLLNDSAATTALAMAFPRHHACHAISRISLFWRKSLCTHGYCCLGPSTNNYGYFNTNQPSKCGTRVHRFGWDLGVLTLLCF